MMGHGFVSYLDVDRAADLSDRRAYPRVICHIESLHRLGEVELPQFDLVILDEVESVLRHWASPTVAAPVGAMSKFMYMLQGAPRGVVTLDAAWGPLTHTILQRARLTNILVVNECAPAQPRTFSFTNDCAAWTARIMEDLKAGRKFVVASLSSEKILALRDAAKEYIDEARIMCHTAKIADEVKRLLKDVDALWVKFLLVLYSPTIAAGVDFSTPHFDRMYFYMCGMSALPATALQMLFRVRHLGDPVVRCCTSPCMRIDGRASSPPVNNAQMMDWLRWMAGNLRAENNVDRQALVPVRTRMATDDLQQPATTSMVPPETYWYDVMAFVEAEKYNAVANYMREFVDVAEAAGHVVTVESIVKQPQSAQKAARPR